MSFTAELLAFAAAPHALPEPARAAAVRLLLDTLAVGCAGSGEVAAEQVFAVARGMGEGTQARLLGRAERMPAPAAAFVNGFHIHCLEWDAVHEVAVVHALSVVTAALLAVIDAEGGADRQEALAALVVGVDVAAGLGLTATGPMRFFRPATAGLIGAALACARVAGLPTPAFADVLGLAYSQCAGTMQAHVEGSVALPLQIGLAARAAVTAVELVRAGLTGPHDALEGPFGYFALFEAKEAGRYAPSAQPLSPEGEGLSGRAAVSPLLLRRGAGGEGARWLIEEVSVKPYPSGRASHAALAALAERRDARTLVAHVPPLIHRLIGRPWVADMTPAYARLCLPYLATLMVRDGRIDPRAFTADSFAGPALRALIDVTVEVEGNPDANALSPQTIMLDGEEVRVVATLGSPAAPLSAEQQAEKERACFALARDPFQAAAIAADPLSWFAGAAP